MTQRRPNIYLLLTLGAAFVALASCRFLGGDPPPTDGLVWDSGNWDQEDWN